MVGVWHGLNNGPLAMHAILGLAARAALGATHNRCFPGIPSLRWGQ